MTDKKPTENDIADPQPTKSGTRLSYDTNPFVTTSKEGEDGQITVRESMRVPVVTRRKNIQATGVMSQKDYYVAEDEDKVITHTFVEQELVDSDQYIKMYSRYITDWLFELSKAAQRALVVILQIYQTEGINRDTVYVNHRAAKEFDSKIHQRTFQRGLAELHKAKIIAPAAKGLGWYWINPHYFFNGNRIAFGKVIRRRNDETDQSLLELS